MIRNYVVDVDVKDESLASEILEEFVNRGNIDVASCERILNKGRAVSCFYVRCPEDDLENFKNALIERGVELL